MQLDFSLYISSKLLTCLLCAIHSLLLSTSQEEAQGQSSDGSTARPLGQVYSISAHEYESRDYQLHTEL